MILKKDIDAKFIRVVEQAIRDIEDIKKQINTLNENDSTIETNIENSLLTFEQNVSKIVNDVGDSLNNLIDKNSEDMKNVYAEFAKIYEVIKIREKEYKDLTSKNSEKIDKFIKKYDSIEGYFKQENGRLKGVKLPEDRLLDDKFRVETVTEIVHEQPIIKEVEKKTTPIITKSKLEHFFDYGDKLSEEVMAPKYIQGYDRLQVDKEASPFYKADKGKKILLFKFIRTLLLVFLEDGTTEITNVVKGSSIYKGNIIKEIRKQLSLEISPMEITSLQPSGSGFFIATKNNGVLYYNIFEKTISSRMTDDDVIYIETVEDKTLLVSDTLSIYNENDIRVYSSKLLVNKGLKPLKVEKLADGRIAVLCGGEQKGLAGLLYLFEFKNGELTQKFIYTDPFDRRDTYFYDLVSDNKTMSVIGNRDGNYVSYVYEVDKLDERYRVVVMEKEFDLLSVAYNSVNDDFLLVFDDKLVLNNKVIYGIGYSDNRDIVFKDNFAYCIYDSYVERIDITPSVGTVFKFPVVLHGDGQDTKIVIKKEGDATPIIRVDKRVLKTHVLGNYVYIPDITPGDAVEVDINGANIVDISIYSEYSLTLE